MIRVLLFAFFFVSIHGQGLADETARLHCAGALKQGGLLVCEGPPGMRVEAAGRRVVAGQDGVAIIGLKRDAPDILDISIASEQGESLSDLTLPIAPRQDKFRVIEGLDCDKVDARTEEQKAHAGRSWTKKVSAFASFNEGPGPAQGFILPAEGRPTSPFGPARKYVGVSAKTGEPCDKTSVHQGYDLAAPVGTPIIAPAPGVVVLADPDLYYEGGTIFLDHGHGLVSVFMHMSSVDVGVGDRVVRGEHLGATGNTGRTTGPHLHWAVKWRDQSHSDRSSDFYIDPELLLNLPPLQPLPKDGPSSDAVSAADDKASDSAATEELPPTP